MKRTRTISSVTSERILDEGVRALLKRVLHKKETPNLKIVKNNDGTINYYINNDSVASDAQNPDGSVTPYIKPKKSRVNESFAKTTLKKLNEIKNDPMTISGTIAKIRQKKVNEDLTESVSDFFLRKKYSRVFNALQKKSLQAALEADNNPSSKKAAKKFDHHFRRSNGFSFGVTRKYLTGKDKLSEQKLDERFKKGLKESSVQPWGDRPIEGPEKKFLDKHTIIQALVTADGKDYAGNDVNGPPYKGGVKAHTRFPRHGYDAGQDKKVYEAYNEAAKCDYDLHHERSVDALESLLKHLKGHKSILDKRSGNKTYQVNHPASSMKDYARRIEDLSTDLTHNLTTNMTGNGEIKPMSSDIKYHLGGTSYNNYKR